MEATIQNLTEYVDIDEAWDATQMWSQEKAWLYYLT